MTFYRDDYTPPHYRLPKTELTFTLNPSQTVVQTILSFEDYQVNKPLVLDGIDLKLKEILLDGKPCPYQKTETTLTLQPKKKKACCNFSAPQIYTLKKFVGRI